MCRNRTLGTARKKFQAWSNYHGRLTGNITVKRLGVVFCELLSVGRYVLIYPPTHNLAKVSLPPKAYLIFVTLYGISLVLGDW